MTKQERLQELKKAKAEYREMKEKQPFVFKTKRDEIIAAIVGAEVPNMNIKFSSLG